MGAQSRKLSKREIKKIEDRMSSYMPNEDAFEMRQDLGPRPYGAPPRFAGDDPWLSPETWPQMPTHPAGHVNPRGLSTPGTGMPIPPGHGSGVLDL